ncbi:hypothetical protein ACHAXS_007480 [Conticribra weissflogii]
MSHRPRKKFHWHPSHRPPPPEAIKSARIAVISPIGKSLETALGEIQAEDEHTRNEEDNDCGEVCQSVHSNATKKSRENNDSRGSKRKQFSGEQAEHIMEHDGGEPNPKLANGRAESNQSKKIRLDESFAQSILDTYCTAFAQSSFENDASKNNHYPFFTRRSNVTNIKESSSAPAAMLQGEIDHYNRIGGQWRMVVKNAIIRPRTVVESDNGLGGLSKRYRHVLDWRGNKNEQTSTTLFGLSANDEKINGKIQILAYDDEDCSIARVE